jgi:hypothetical protein
VHLLHVFTLARLVKTQCTLSNTNATAQLSHDFIVALALKTMQDFSFNQVKAVGKGYGYFLRVPGLESLTIIF